MLDAQLVKSAAHLGQAHFVDLLIGLGLLPGCMGIEQTEFEGGELPEGYFESVQRACLAEGK